MWVILIESFYSYIFLSILYKCGTGFFIVFLLCFLLNESLHLRIIIYSPIKMTRASLVAQMLKNLLQCRRPRFDPWVGKIPWRRERLPIPVFWPGEFHGLRNFHVQDDYYQKPENNKSWWGFVEISTLVHYWWEYNMV